MIEYKTLISSHVGRLYSGHCDVDTFKYHAIIININYIKVCGIILKTNQRNVRKLDIGQTLETICQVSGV